MNSEEEEGVRRKTRLSHHRDQESGPSTDSLMGRSGRGEQILDRYEKLADRPYMGKKRQQEDGNRFLRGFYSYWEGESRQVESGEDIIKEPKKQVSLPEGESSRNSRTSRESSRVVT